VTFQCSYEIRDCCRFGPTLRSAVTVEWRDLHVTKEVTSYTVRPHTHLTTLLLSPCDRQPVNSGKYSDQCRSREVCWDYALHPQTLEANNRLLDTFYSTGVSVLRSLVPGSHPRQYITGFLLLQSRCRRLDLVQCSGTPCVSVLRQVSEYVGFPYQLYF
jgi:hypothetical protein